MSNQEDTILEPTEEIEENSEIEDEESMVDNLDLEMPDDYDVFEDEEDEPEAKRLVRTLPVKLLKERPRAR